MDDKEIINTLKKKQYCPRCELETKEQQCEFLTQGCGCVCHTSKANKYLKVKFRKGFFNFGA